ncbi:MAG: DUF2306 domain-containing protein [Pseudomonadota bacterium]
MSTQLPRIITIGFWLMIASSVSIGLYAYAFQAGLTGAGELRASFAQVPIAAAAHVLGGGTILILGGFQFWASFRTRQPRWHRISGRIYLILVAIGGVAGLFLATRSMGGLVAHFGFGMLAVIWLFTGWQAYAAIRRGDVPSHRAWMIRNYALALAAVALRIYLGLFSVAPVPFDQAYQAVAWISWVPNLVIVEWYFLLQAQAKRAA